MANYDWPHVRCDKKSNNYFKSNNLDSNFLLQQHAAVIHELSGFNFTTKELFNLQKHNFQSRPFDLRLTAEIKNCVIVCNKN
jgi:hypothetical protein